MRRRKPRHRIGHAVHQDRFHAHGRGAGEDDEVGVRLEIRRHVHGEGHLDRRQLALQIRAAVGDVSLRVRDLVEIDVDVVREQRRDARINERVEHFIPQRPVDEVVEGPPVGALDDRRVEHRGHARIVGLEERLVRGPSEAERVVNVPRQMREAGGGLVEVIVLAPVPAEGVEISHRALHREMSHPRLVVRRRAQHVRVHHAVRRIVHRTRRVNEREDGRIVVRGIAHAHRAFAEHETVRGGHKRLLAAL